MNREDIIRMAREAHLDVYGLGKDHKKFVLVVERFAALVAAAEREACAKVCEQFYTESDAEFYRSEFASAIRARGQE